MIKKSIGIVGFGDFGKLLVRELSPYFKVFVYDNRGVSDPNVNDADLKTVLSQPIIIPAIPAQFFEDFFKENSSIVSPDALVVDICSVKIRPQAVLERLLPKTCSILATHPMFGPNSTPNGIVGKQIMMHPTRIDQDSYEKIKLFISSSLGLKVIECTPDEHDKMMAYVQGLSHYIGRVMQEMGIPETELSTRAYDDLYDMRMIQGNDSWELFRSIMHENPHAAQVNQLFKQAMKELDEKLEKN